MKKILLSLLFLVLGLNQMQAGCPVERVELVEEPDELEIVQREPEIEIETDDDDDVPGLIEIGSDDEI